MTKLAYGIDFGTTNTSLALSRDGSLVDLIDLDKTATDPTVLRSVIYISPKKEFLFGSQAIQAYLVDVAQGEVRRKKIVSTGKKVKIAKYSHISGYGGEILVDEIFEVEEGSGGRLLQSLKSGLSSSLLPVFDLFGTNYSLEDLIAIFLAEIKNRSDQIIGQKVDQLVIGRPVNFVGDNNDLALTRLEKSAHLAGFKSVKFEYEPIGAAWEYSQENNQKKNIFVFDFGGGTLDFSVVRFPDKKVLATFGLPIGGDLFNTNLFNAYLANFFGQGSTHGYAQLPLPRYIYDQLSHWYTISMMKTAAFESTLENLSFMCSNPSALSALKSLVFNNLGFALYEEIDRVKKSLSFTEKEKLNFIAKDIEIMKILSRNQFEQVIENELSEINQGIEKTLNEANIKADEVDIVVTTGGSSLIPIVQSLLKNKFKTSQIASRNTYTSVATGLALRAKEIFV